MEIGDIRYIYIDM